MADAALTDFEMGPVLGQGGMATVYRARDKRSGEAVALKLMLANVADDDTFIERFRREAKATMGVRHPNVCRVIAAGEDSGRLYMAMEIIDGGSVRELKQKFGGRLPVQLAADLVFQLLDALGAAHAQGIIHRDLKPANLMLTSTGVLKLVDFGIAKSTKDATLTATGMLVGTPAYMSPEQVSGEGIDGRSDLFSAGLILHDLLCGRSPFYSDNPGTSLVKVLKEEVPGIFDVMFGVDAVVETVHGRLTAKEPARRFANATAALAALRPYVDGVRARHPNLVAECLANPAAMKALLFHEQAEHEQHRAETLLAKHGPCPAAALALENALHLEPHAHTRTQLEEVNAALGIGAVVDDPRILDALASHKADPNNPGVLKRLADLYRAGGNLRESARFMKRYLKFKDDTAALQQLVILLYGPGSDPSLVTSTLQRVVPVASPVAKRTAPSPFASQSLPEPSPSSSASTPALRTQDIVAGIKTSGNMRAPTRTESALKTVTPEQKAAIAMASERRSMSEEAAVIRGLTDDDEGLFSRLREQAGVWWYVAIGVVVVALGVGVTARFVSAGVDKAQKDMKGHAENTAIVEENTAFNFQTTKLNEAREALKKGSFISCAIAATQSLQGQKTAKFVLDAYWLQAQCALLARDYSQAKEALAEFKDNANITDKRYEIAKAQLAAIARGEEPAGVRE
jgi:serine/threonine protein kinase